MWIELVVERHRGVCGGAQFHLFFVKPQVFLHVAMVWLQAQVGPAAQVRSVWEHHQKTTDPLQAYLAAGYHTGEQVSGTAEGTAVMEVITCERLSLI